MNSLPGRKRSRKSGDVVWRWTREIWERAEERSRTTDEYDIARDAYDTISDAFCFKRFVIGLNRRQCHGNKTYKNEEILMEALPEGLRIIGQPIIDAPSKTHDSSFPSSMTTN